MPSDPKKTTIQIRASASGEFGADKNGNVQGSLTINPSSATQVGFSCPNGQTAARTSVSYSNVSISDATSGATFAIKGTF